MPEPITIAAATISGLVSLYKAYTVYKAATAKATATNTPPPAKSDAVTQGEQTALTIKAGVQQHGEPKDVRAIESFEDDPETYQEALQKVLERVATSSQPFAQQLQTLAQQANLQTGSVQGSVNVTGQGKVYGTAAGVVSPGATITGGTYTINENGEQGGGKA